MVGSRNGQKISFNKLQQHKGACAISDVWFFERYAKKLSNFENFYELGKHRQSLFCIHQPTYAK